MVSRSEALTAVLEFKRVQLTRAAERVEPISGVGGGLAVMTPSLPRVWELNLVFAPGGEDRETIERLMEASERLQEAAGLRHRKLRLGGGGSAHEALETLASAAGWNFERELVMVRRRPPERTPATRVAVREITANEAAVAEDQFLVSEPYGRDPEARRQLIAQHGRWERAATVTRRIGIVEDERVLAWCRLYETGGVTEIDSVGVLSAMRGRGLGRALLEGALSRVPQAHMLFLCADTDDWPKHLYSRLGFDVVGERLSATKALAAEAASAR